MCIRDRKHVVFFQAEDGIRDVERSRGLGDVYKRQRGNPYEKYRGVPKWGVIKGCDKGDVIKGV